MANQYPKVKLTINVIPPKDPESLTDEFTKALAEILVKRLPKSVDSIDDFLKKIVQDL